MIWFRRDEVRAWMASGVIGASTIEPSSIKIIAFVRRPWVISLIVPARLLSRTSLRIGDEDGVAMTRTLLMATKLPKPTWSNSAANSSFPHLVLLGTLSVV